MRNGREPASLPAMNRTPLIAILLPIAIAAIALPALAVWTIKPGTDQLQQIADKSCKCERRAGDASAGKACWRNFERLTHADLDNPAMTACFPLSEESVSVGDNGSGDIVLRYHVVGGGGLYLCSRQEALVGEAIWAHASNQGETEPERDQAFQRANAQLISFAKALKRGERLEKLKSLYGCVTGY